MKSQGCFVISLDFELIWGVFDHSRIENNKEYFKNTIEFIPKIIELFEENELRVTWATVGMLFNENWDEWIANIPIHKPTYLNQNLDSYTFGLKYYKKEKEPYFFAPHIVKMLSQTKGQEVGSHSYSHYYCNELGQKMNQFEIDLKLALKLASKYNLTLKSFIFPRNQFNNDYLSICKNNGIKTVRSNPDNWFWDMNRPTTLIKKISRTADAYYFSKSSSYNLKLNQDYEVFLQKSSRFLRPIHRFRFLNDLHLETIKKEMIYAANKGKTYHIWFHPHNIGNYPLESLERLERILEIYRSCSEKYGMKNLTMSELVPR